MKLMTLFSLTLVAIFLFYDSVNSECVADYNDLKVIKTIFIFYIIKINYRNIKTAQTNQNIY